MKKSFVTFLLMAGLVLVAAGSAFATATVSTLASTNMSADTAGTGGSGAYTTPTGPVLTEGANRDVGTGAIVLNAPTGFQFNPSATVSVTVSRVAGAAALLTLSAPTGTVTTSSISITVSAQDANDSTTRSLITWSGIQVRPTAGTPLATTGNITKASGGAGITGVTAGTTSFGTLTEVVGAPTKLGFSTQPTNMTAGVTMGSFAVQVQDQFTNAVAQSGTTVTLTLNGSTIFSGTNPRTTDANGKATFNDLVVRQAGNGLNVTTANDASLANANSANFNILPAAASAYRLSAADTTPQAGVADQLTINLVDQYQNIVTNFNSTKILTFSGLTAGADGTLPTVTDNTGAAKNFGTTTTISFTKGISSLGGSLMAHKPEGPVNVAVTDGTLSTATVGGAPVSLTVSVGDPSAYRLSAASATPAAGASDVLTVKLVDRYQNVVTTFTGDKSLTFAGLAASPTGAQPTVTDNTSTPVNLGAATTISFTSGQNSDGGTLVAYKSQGPVAFTATDGSLSTSTTGGTNVTLTVSFLAHNAFRLSAASSTPTAGANDALKISAADQYGNTVTNYTGSHSLTFSGLGNSPGGTVPTVAAVALGSATAVTFAGGTNSATVNLIAFKREAATLAVTEGVRSTSNTGGTGASLTVNPSAASAYRLSAADTTPEAGVADQLTISMVDQYQNVETSSNGVKNLTFSGLSAGPDGVLPTVTDNTDAARNLGVATSITFANGISSLGGSLIARKAEGPVNLAVTGGALSTATAGGAPVSLTVSAGAAIKLAFTTQPTNMTAGVTMGSFVVQIRDQFGNNVSSNNVAVTVALDTGSFASGTTTINTGAGGAATFSTLVISSAGSYTMTASAPSTTFTATPAVAFTIAPAAASSVQFLQDAPASVTAGTTFSPAVTVKVTDAFSNNISNKTVTLALLGGGSLSGTVAQATAGNGVATFSNLSVAQAGNKSLTASITSPSLSVTGGTFSVTAAAPTKMVYTTLPAATNTAGVTMSAVVAQIHDQFGNNVSSNDVPVTVALNTGAFANGTTTVNTGAGGSATFNDLVMNAAGNYTLTASASGTTFTATPASAFIVIPTTASSVAFIQGPPLSINAGATFSPAVTVKVTDQFSNVISNKTVTMSLNGGGTLNGTLSQPTAGSGVATFSNLSVNLAGSDKSLTASITSPSLSVTSSTFTVNVGPIDHYIVSAASPQTRGIAFNTTVAAQDLGSNAVVDSSTVVAMTGTGSAQFDSNGDSTFGDNTKILSSGTLSISAMETYAGSITLTATDGNGKTGTSSPITINATAGDYRSAATGNWSATATWQIWNGAAWVAASSPPAGGAGTNITVQSGHTVTDNVAVSLNGVLIVQGTLSFSGSGVLTVASGGLVQNAGTINGSTSALIFNAGSTYQHARNGGTIPTALWNVNATCLISGVTSTVPSGFGQTFGNFNWDCPGQTGTLNLGGNLDTVGGNFTLTSTGSGILALGGALQHVTLAIGGNFSQTGGTLHLSNGNDFSNSQSITVAKDFSLSGGTLDMSPYNLIGFGDTVNLSVGGNFSHTGGTLTETGANSSKTIIFNGTAPQIYTSGGTVANGISFTVNSGATLMMGTSLLGNGSSGAFTLSAGATLGIGNALGITTSGASGNIRVTGTRSYNIGANYIYNGSVAQVTSNGLPATVSNLTISNTAATVTLGSNVIVSNNLTVATGTFDMGSFTANRATSGGTLTVANGATLKIGGTNPFPANYATRNLGATSTVDYKGSAQNVSAQSYGHLTTSGSGAKTLQSGATSIAGNLTIGSGTTFAAGANDFNLAGNWSNNGSGFTFSGAQTVTFNGASPQTIGGTVMTLNNVAINSGSVLNLAFTGSSTVSALSIAGVTKAAGTWGATGSGATHVDDTYFQGTTGILNVTSGSASDSATAVATSGTPSIYGVSVTFTATVTGVGPTPTGTVTFKDGANSMGTLTLDGAGHATFSTNTLPVGAHSITADYSGDGTFAGSTSSALSQTIDPAALTVTGITASNKFYNGNIIAGIDTTSASLVGVVGGDSVTLDTGAASGLFVNRNAGVGKMVNISGLGISGAGTGNYTLTQPTTAANIIPYPLTVTAATNSKMYDTTPSAAASPAITSGSLQDIDTAVLSETYDNKNVGTGKTLTPAAAITDGNGGNNYIVTLVPDTTGEITVRSLTVTASGENKPYDGTMSATVTLHDNRLAGDTFSDNYTSASFADPGVGNDKPVSVTGITITSGDAGNYELTSDSASTTANITPATLTVVAEDKTRPYAQDNPPLTFHYTGFVNSENDSVLTGSPDLSTTALTNSPAGDYPITITVSSLSAANYSFVPTNGTLTVDKVLLTVTADDLTVPYGTTNPVFTATFSGFVNDDTTNVLAGTTAFSTTAISNSTVAGSPYPISVTNGTLSAVSYNFVFVDGNLIVTQAVLTVTADDQTKVYGSDVPELTVSYTGFANGEDTNVLTGVLDISTTVTTNSPVAGNPYDIIVTNGTLAADNYIFDFVNGELTVTTASLTGHITASDKVYNGDTNATINSYSLDDVLGSDDVSLTGGTANFADKNVGDNKAVTATGLTLTGADVGNYELASGSASTTASITPAPLTAHITASDKVYDTTPDATITDRTLTGVLGSDDVSLTGGSASFSDKNVGTGKSVTASGFSLDGTDKDNYALSPDSATTTASITPVSLTGHITASDKVYNGLTDATITGYSLDGVLGSDLVTLGGGTANFDDKNVGTGKSVTATGLTLSGDDAGNYELVPASASTSAAITRADLTVTADNKVKTQGLPNPALTATYSGFVNSEDPSVLTTPVSLNTTATDSSPVGSYPITASGGVAANYTIGYLDGTMMIVAVPQLKDTVKSGNQFMFSFATLSNETYQVEYKDDLGAATWTPLGDPLPGTGGSISVTNEITGPRRFFRIEINVN